MPSHQENPPPMSGRIARTMREDAGLTRQQVAEGARRTPKDVEDFEREIADDTDLGLDIFQALRRLGGRRRGKRLPSQPRLEG